MSFAGDFSIGAQIVAGTVVGMVVADQKKKTMIVSTPRGYVEIAKTTPARPALDSMARDAVLRQLVAPRTDDEPAPAPPEKDEVLTTPRLVALARELRRPEPRLDRAAIAIVRAAEAVLFDELCGEGTSPRMLRRLVRLADGSIDPPESPYDFLRHEWMGCFEVADTLVVADPCYAGEEKPLLSISVPARAGTWHAYLRYGEGHKEPTLAMFVAHEAHLDDVKKPGDELGTFGVDSGHVLMFDARARKDPALLERLADALFFEEGIHFGVGCLAETAHGDGLYNARVLRAEGRAVMVRAGLVSGDETYDYFKPPAAA